MRLQALRRFSVGLAIVSLISGFAFAEGSTTFVCRGDMVARPYCCCPNGGGRDSLTSEQRLATLSAACCCDVSQVKATALGTAVPRAVAQVDSAPAPLVPLVTGNFDLVPTSDLTWLAIRMAHPPPLAITILLGKQSFLI